MRSALLGLLVAACAASSAWAQVARSNSSIECSRKADELGLHGTERQEFRKKCRAEAAGAPTTGQAGQPAPTSPGQAAPPSPVQGAAAPSDGELVLEFPAPGCPQQLPTYNSLSDYCGKLEEPRCKAATARCSWSNSKCTIGSRVAYISPGSTDPEALARMGLPSIGLAISERGTALANNAYTAAANRQYARAIALYNEAVKADPDSSVFWVMRGLVYESSGQKKPAVADYCTGLTHGNDWQAEETARQRIEQLTQQNVKPMPIPKFMKNGVIKTRSRPALAPLKIQTPDGSDYLLKLINTKDDAEEMLIFVRSSSTLEVSVPFGVYKIRGASGAVWYDPAILFGPKTRYFKLVGKSSDDTFTFVRDGNVARGHSVRLIKQKEGNLETPSIGREEFEK